MAQKWRSEAHGESDGMNGDRVPTDHGYAQMPDVGTMRICWFCHKVVTLKRADSGWHYWCADLDPVDGRHHCLGGRVPANRFDSIPRTLHLPEPVMDDDGNITGPRWHHRYTPDGVGRFM